MNLFEQRDKHANLRARRNALNSGLPNTFADLAPLKQRHAVLQTALAACRPARAPARADSLRNAEEALEAALEAYRQAKARVAGARAALRAKKAELQTAVEAPDTQREELLRQYQEVVSQLGEQKRRKLVLGEWLRELKKMHETLNQIGPVLANGGTVDDAVLVAMDEQLKTMEAGL